MKTNLGSEEIKRACSATLDDFVNKVKGLPTYGIYVDSVKNGMQHTNKGLQLSAMTVSMIDDEFGLMMNSVAMDLLFSMIDQRLRYEILEEEK